MIDKYTAQAATTEQAVEKGLKALGITEDEAVIEVSKHGKKGFLGIGQQDAVVVVKRKEKNSILDNVFSDNPIEREKLSNMSISDKDSVTKDSKKQEKTSDKQKSVAKKEVKTMEPKPSAEKKETHSKEKVQISEKSSDSEKVSSKKQEKSREPKKVEEDSTDQLNDKEIDQQGMENVRVYIGNIVRNMGALDVEVYLSHEGRQVKYDIETEDAGLVIGRHGKVLNGIQTLAQTQLHKYAKNKLFVKVDVEKYRDRRKQTVEKIARKTADKVKQKKKTIALEPMPSHERKQIHRYLHSYPGVQTHSEGKEPNRYLVIEPTNK